MSDSKLMWDDYAEIADELAKKHQNVDLLHLSDGDLRKMVVDLENFGGSARPTNPDIYEAIITVWSAIVADDGDYNAAEFDAEI